MISIQALDYRGEISIIRHYDDIKAVVIQDVLYKMKSIVDGNDVDFRSALHNQFSNYTKISLKRRLFKRLLNNVVSNFKI